MRWLSVLSWSLVGLASASIGCLLGSLLGSFLPQTVVSTAAAGAAFGALAGRWRLAVVAAAATVALSLPAFFLGTITVSPLIAWPLAGLAMGLTALPGVRRTRDKVGTVISAPVLAAAGFGGGATLVILLGLALESSRWVSHFMLGGAAGFGFLVLAGLRIATRRTSQ